MELVIPIKQLKTKKVALVGGKASQLGQLRGCRVKTAPGFVVTTAAFNLFLKSGNIRPEIIAILKSIDHTSSSSIEKSSQKIKHLIINQPVPKPIVAVVKESITTLSGNTFAVRSSGVVEDAQKTSWAGEFDTYLHRSPKSIMADIKKCWASRFNPRALIYQQEQKINASEIEMAVIVQSMISSEVAGVGFSINPVTKDPDELIIEAGLGLGESLVSGQITPDHYEVDKYSFNILDKTISSQAFYLKQGKNGIAKRVLKQIEGSQQKLSDTLIKKLAKQIVLVEKHFGHPCDIEWAAENGQIYILQSRPITGFDKAETISSTHLYKQMWEAAGFGGLGINIALIESLRFRKEFSSFAEKNWFLTSEKTQCTMYYSQEDMKQAGKWGKKDFLNDKWYKQYLRRSRRGYQNATSLVNQYQLEKLQKLSRDELYLLSQRAGYLLAELFAYFTMCQPQCTADLEKTLNTELREVASPVEIPGIVAELTRPINMTTVEKEQLDWLRLCSMDMKETKIRSHMEKHSREYGIIGTASSSGYLGADYYQKLFKGRNKKTAIREYKQKQKYWQNVSKNKNKFAKKLKISKDALKITNIIAHVGYNRFELRLRGWMPLYFWFFSSLLPTLENRYGLRADLGMHLTFSELLQFLTSKQVDVGELKKRSRFFFYLHNNGEAEIISGDRGKKRAKKMVPPLPKNVKRLSGQVAQVGMVTGKAYILRWDAPNLNELMDEMPKGTILVVGQTLPHLMPAIKKASAIVTDEGGMASHSAIVSRELDIPCIIGTGLATKLIKTGQKLRVNANEGVIELLIKG